MIAHKIGFYNGKNGKSLGQAPIVLPPAPADAVPSGTPPNGSALNTLFIVGSMLAVIVLAITVVNSTTSRD